MTGCSELLAIASVLRSLSGAALKTLVYLASRAEGDMASVSSREISKATGQARGAVQSALDSLEALGYISVERSATAVRPAVFRLSVLRVSLVPPVRGSKNEPPQPFLPFGVAQSLSHPGAMFEPLVAQKMGHPGSKNEPPDIERGTRARDVESIFDTDTDLSIRRVLASDPEKTDPRLMQTAREWLHLYMRRWGRSPSPQPPDAKIVAQFLAVSEWPRLEGMLRDMMSAVEPLRPSGTGYAWFVTVAMQRMLGLRPEDVKRARAELGVLKGGRAAAAAAAAGGVGSGLAAQVAALAAKKGMK